MKNPPYALGTCAIAGILCRGERTVARRIDSGLLRGFRLPFGSHRRVRVKDLVAFAGRHGMGELTRAAGLKGGDGS